MTSLSPQRDEQLFAFCHTVGIIAKPVHADFGIVLHLNGPSSSIGDLPLPQGWLQGLAEKFGLVIVKGQHQLVQNAHTQYVPTMSHLLGRPLQSTEDLATLKGAPEVQLLGSPNSSFEPSATFIPAHGCETKDSFQAWLDDLVACEVTDWHTDEPWDTPPARFTVALCAVSTGPNATQFSSTTALYDRVDLSIRNRLEGTKTLFEPPPWLPTELGKQGRHNTVNDGPSGKSFFICMDSTTQIDGMTERESKEVVWNLTREAMQPEHKYQHQWEEGDLLIWDGACTLHARTLYSHENVDRVLYRLRVGEGHAVAIPGVANADSSTEIKAPVYCSDDGAVFKSLQQTKDPIAAI